MPAVGCGGCTPVALERVLVHVVARDLEPVGEHLRLAELGPQPAVDHPHEVGAERTAAAARVRCQRRVRHRLDAARDRDVVDARHDAGRHEMDRLLRRPALTVDGGGRHPPRETRRDPGVARDVGALLAPLGDAPTDDIVDDRGVDIVALEQVLQRVAEQVGRVPVGQRALALSERSADRVDDDGFANLGHP